MTWGVLGEMELHSWKLSGLSLMGLCEECVDLLLKHELCDAAKYLIGVSSEWTRG